MNGLGHRRVRAVRVVAAAVVVGLAIYFYTVGLQAANELGGAISAVIALATLLGSWLPPVRERTVATKDQPAESRKGEKGKALSRAKPSSTSSPAARKARQRQDPGSGISNIGLPKFFLGKLGIGPNHSSSGVGVVALAAIAIVMIIAVVAVVAMFFRSGKGIAFDEKTPVPSRSGARVSPSSTSANELGGGALAPSAVARPTAIRKEPGGPRKPHPGSDVTTPTSSATPTPSTSPRPAVPPSDPATVTCPSTDRTVYSCNGGMLLDGSAGGSQPSNAYMEEWRVRDDRSDLWRDGTGFFTENGGQLAIVDNSSALSRNKCALVKVWRDRVDFSELARGSQLCMRTAGNGRYAGIVVLALPNARSSHANIAGYTWR